MKKSEHVGPRGSARRLLLPPVLAVTVFVPVMLIAGGLLAVLQGVDQPSDLIGTVAVLFPSFSLLVLPGALLYVVASELFHAVFGAPTVTARIALSPILLAGFALLGVHHGLLAWNWLVGCVVGGVSFGLIAHQLLR